LSRRAIAEQTDSTVAQIQGRLARGRRLLRSRFLRRGMSLSLAAGSIASTAASAKAAVTAGRVAGTAEQCVAFKTSGLARGLSPAAIALAKEGVKAMWIALIAKCSAIAATVLVAGGIVLAAHETGQNGKNAGTGGEKRMDVQVADHRAAEANKPQNP